MYYGTGTFFDPLSCFSRHFFEDLRSSHLPMGHLLARTLPLSTLHFFRSYLTLSQICRGRQSGLHLRRRSTEYMKVPAHLGMSFTPTIHPDAPAKLDPSKVKLLSPCAVLIMGPVAVLVKPMPSGLLKRLGHHSHFTDGITA